MKNYVLFSPLGLTDPVKGEYDGPFLHILRHFKPVKAYIFLTKETKIIDDKDNRYERMAKKLLPSCEIIKLDYSHIVKANNFLVFDEPFETEIKKIKAENPDSNILVNITSGTAQMEATLYLLSAVLPFPVTAVQVSTWQNSSNTGYSGKAFNAETEWDNLLDNEIDESIKNRCVTVVPENIRKRVVVENIICLINNLDYYGALQILEPTKDLFDPEFVHFLEAASSRLALNVKKAMQELRLAGIPVNEVFYIETSGIIEVYEYILYLKVKTQKNELADFSRAISPVLTDLFKEYIVKKLKKPIDSWCEVRKEILKLKACKLPVDLKNYLDSIYPNGFKDTPLAASNLLEIMAFYQPKNSNAKVLETAKTLRDFEEKVRNIAAHETVGVDENFLKAKTNMSSEQVLNLLFKMFDYVYAVNKKGMWDSYSAMNAKLISCLK